MSMKMQFSQMKWLVAISQFLIPYAFADAPSAGPAGGFTPMIPLALMFGIFYFLVMRPQQKKQKEHQKFLGELKKGDMVVTNSGIVGTIRTLSDRFITLEVDDGVCLKMIRGQISENAANLAKEIQTKELQKA